MQTVDPIIRPIVTTRSRRASKPVSRVEVYFDFGMGMLAVEDAEGNRKHVSGIVLEQAEFTVKDGERDGCGATGKLGFVNGVVREDSIPGDIGNMQSVSWGGEYFTNNQKPGKVVAADTVLIVGKSMLANGLVTDR